MLIETRRKLNDNPIFKTFKAATGVFLLVRSVIKVAEFSYKWGTWSAKTELLDNNVHNEISTQESTWASYTYDTISGINAVRILSLMKNIGDSSVKSVVPHLTIMSHLIGKGLDYIGLEESCGKFYGSILHYGPELVAMPLFSNLHKQTKYDFVHNSDTIKHLVLPMSFAFTYFAMKGAEESYETKVLELNTTDTEVQTVGDAHKIDAHTEL